jgi:hypothetical protein
VTKTPLDQAKRPRSSGVSRVLRAVPLISRTPRAPQAVIQPVQACLEPDDEGRWVITDRTSGEVFISPADTGDPTRDTAYIARLHRRGRVLLAVAGVHALGSVGAVEYLRRNLADLYAAVGDAPFSLVVTSTFDGTTVKDTTALWGPNAHP